MARVAAYLRRSTEGEEDKNYSLQSQLKDIAAWAEREGHEHVATFSDPGGRSYSLDRPALQDLFQAAKRREFDMVAVWRYDRFSRDEEQAIIAVHMLKQSGVKVVSISQPIPDGPLGTVMLSLHNFADAQELQGIRERVARGKLERIRSGKLPTMALPKYGYQFAGEKKEKYEPHPLTAPVVVRIFNDFVGGRTIRSIASALTKEGVPTPSEVLAREGHSYKKGTVTPMWRPSTVHKILKDKAYIGQMEGNATVTVRVTVTNPITGEERQIRRQIARPWSTGERVLFGPEVCPPLVNESIFEQAQEQMTLNRERSSRHTKHPEEVLLRAGIGVCGYCGRPLTINWSNRGNSYRYVCLASRRLPDKCSAPKFSMSVPNLDKIVWEWFMERLTSPDMMQQAYDSYCHDIAQVQGNTGSELQAVEAALAEAKAQEESYIQAVGMARNDNLRAEYMLRAEEAHTKVEARTKALGELKHRHLKMERDKRGFKTLVETASQAAQFLAEAPIEQRRQALYLCKVKVQVYGAERLPRYTVTWFADYVHAHVPAWTQITGFFQQLAS